MKKVAIIGKSSYIGNDFENYLQNKDEYIVDKISSRNNDWKEITFTKYDVIYFVAGIAHRDINKTDHKLYYEVNTDLAIEIAKKAKEEGAKQFILLSSIAVFGLEGVIGKECNIDNYTKEKPITPYGDSKLKADVYIQSMNDENFKVVIVRPPMVYGRECKGNYTKMDSMSKKVAVFPKFKNQRSMIYIKNLDEFIKRCIDENVNGIFYPQNKDYVQTYEMYKLMRQTRNKKTWCTSLFNWIIKLFGNHVRILRKLLGNDTIDKNLSNTFNFEYAKYNLEESINEINK